jgi:hypothetical protein
MALGEASDRWQRVSSTAHQRWDRLTEEDLNAVRGNAERLVSLLQGRYGFARDQALKELTEWRNSLAGAQTSTRLGASVRPEAERPTLRDGAGERR